MAKSKLTTTTNDKLAKEGLPVSQPAPVAQPFIPPMNGKVRIAAAHEPLPAEQWTLPPVQLVFPKEQTVNIAPVAEPQPLKIALVGTAPSSRLLAPYNDKSWTIWCCSPGNMTGIPRVDAWFEIHSNLLWPEYRHYGEPYIDWLKKQTFPIYMQDNKLVPNALSLPMRDLVKRFGPYYFTSSFSWMMAMAIHVGCKEMALYGIDMASRDEYILQRPGAYYFFIRAKELGIKVTAPFESDILQPPPLYGYSEATPFGRKMHARKLELQNRLAPMRQQRDSLIQQIHYLEGALEDMDYILAIQGGVQNNSDVFNE